MKMGIQMWSIHDECMRRGVDETMRIVSDMGYTGFEFAVHEYATVEQLWGERPEKIAETMARYGVQPLGIHLNWDLFSADPMTVIRECRILGLPYLGLGHLYYPDREPAERQMAIHKRLGELSRIAADNGMKMLLHVSATGYCRDYKGRYSFEGMLEDVGEEWIQPEFDTAWMVVGGVDPEAYIRKYAGRVDVLHLKEFTGPLEQTEDVMKRHDAITIDRACAIGASGSQNTPGIIETARESGTKWILTELWNEENALENALQSARYIRPLL